VSASRYASSVLCSTAAATQSHSRASMATRPASKSGRKSRRPMPNQGRPRGTRTRRGALATFAAGVRGCCGPCALVIHGNLQRRFGDLLEDRSSSLPIAAPQRHRRPLRARRAPLPNTLRWIVTRRSFQSCHALNKVATIDAISSGNKGHASNARPLPGLKWLRIRQRLLGAQMQRELGSRARSREPFACQCVDPCWRV
jgi:hypothetical protein